MLVHLFMILLSGNSGIDHEPHGADVSGFLHEYPVCVSQDRWTVRGEEVREQTHPNSFSFYPLWLHFFF